MKRNLLLSIFLLPLCLFAQTDYMMYVGMYGKCVDDEKDAPIYGGTYSEYPKGMIDAKFPGGDVEFARFLNNNTELQEVYSGENDKNGEPLLVTGEVIVEFVVDRCGKPCNFRILQSLTDEQDAEALRVMETLPMFMAASLHGYRIKSAYVVTIRFQRDHWPKPKPEDEYDYYDYYYEY